MIGPLVKSAFKSLGLRLTRDAPLRDANELLVWKARRLGVETVLDIGANTGQTGAWLRKAGWTGRIVSFEPLPQAHAQLSAAAAGDPGWHVAEPMALGAENSTATINVSANLASSSLLTVEQRSVDVVPESGFVGEVEIAVRRLDEVMKPEWAGPFAMKIDTQGFEAEVLNGGPGTLAAAQVVMLEMSLVPLYQGGVSFADLYRRMEAEGFRCVAIHEGFSDLAANEMLQVDGVFVRD